MIQTVVKVVNIQLMKQLQKTSIKSQIMIKTKILNTPVKDMPLKVGVEIKLQQKLNSKQTKRSMSTNQKKIKIIISMLSGLLSSTTQLMAMDKLRKAKTLQIIQKKKLNLKQIQMAQKQKQKKDINLATGQQIKKSH